jgi:hypothetical protein
MAQAYTRQSTLADGDTITAALFNDEYNQLLNAFSYHATSASSSGHRHDGTAGGGGSIYRIGDLDFLNKIEADSTNNRWGVFVEVSSAAVEQVRISDGVFSPVTDSDVDIGTSSLYFKDAYIDSVTTTGNVAVGGNLTVTGNATISGNLTFGDAASDTVAFSADVASHLLPSADATYDLGAAASEWNNLYIDGTANIDSLVADTADINGGTIDGVTLGTNSAITQAVIDDIDLNGKVITMTGSSGDTATLTVGTNGTLAITTVDTGGTAANMTLTADGTFEAVGSTITLDSGGAINLEPAAGSAILLDGTISIDAGVVTGATSVTSTAFVGALTGNVTGNTSGTALTVTQAAQSAITSLGTLTTLTVDNVIINGTTIGHTSDTDLMTLTSGVLTVAGEVDAVSLDISGAVDVAGTTNLDVVDIDGAVDMASTLAVAGVLTGASLDISGDIDVDGTTNLDVVDIDGAVDMASTLQVDGAITTNADLNIITSSTSGFKVGDNGATAGALITAYQGSSNTNLRTLEIAAQVFNVKVGAPTGTTSTTAFSIASDGSLSTPTLGTSNVRFGVNAGNSIASGGDYNVVVGDEAGTAITTGDKNVFVGTLAGDATTTAGENVAIGYDSLGTNILGSASVAVGPSALRTQNYGSATNAFNTAVGHFAGYAVTTGIQNTLIGGLAGDAITTASNNTAVGYNSLTANTTGTANVAIGNSALVTNTTGAENVASGTSALYYNSTGTGNVGLGYQAMYYNTTASNNVAVGKNALLVNTTGASNVAVGYNSMVDNTTGATNTAFGEESLANNTTASDNTAIGRKALWTNTTGTLNVAVGETALYSNTTASNNTAVGRLALNANNTGHSNTAVGSAAGDNITTGDNNIIIGYNIDAASATADNQLSIGGWIVGSAGQITMPSQPAFNAYPASVQSNIAINTAVTVVLGTEAFDVGANFASNTFTAPVTGKYQLNVLLQIDALDLDASLYQLQIITSNKSYNLTLSPGSFDADVTYYGITNSVLADMDASDTAVVKIYQAGGAAQADISVDTNFSGYLVC